MRYSSVKDFLSDGIARVGDSIESDEIQRGIDSTKTRLLSLADVITKRTGRDVELIRALKGEEGKYAWQQQGLKNQ